jgi:hypothetical protein
MIENVPAVPAQLRARLAAEYAPVAALRSPLVRTMAIVPLAMLALFAASSWFEVRPDAHRLGWVGVWGLSIVQCAIGLAVVSAALRESIPGRGWSAVAIALWLAIPVCAVVAVTFVSWETSPVFLRREWWLVGGLCFAGSAATALPVVALASVLAARAYPTRPALSGLLLGLGGGLIADAGWRIFCHFSEPAHVLSAHLAAVVMSAAIGSLVSVQLHTTNTRSMNQ